MLQMLVLAIALAGSQLIAQNSPEERVAWNRPIKPFRIVGNIYYVGVSSSSLRTDGSSAAMRSERRWKAAAAFADSTELRKYVDQSEKEFIRS
jgi:hypothetical protein